MARARAGSTKLPRKRDKQVTLRISEAEYKAFRASADELDIDLTTWIRLACRRSVGLPTP